MKYITSVTKTNSDFNISLSIHFRRLHRVVSSQLSLCNFIFIVPCIITFYEITKNATVRSEFYSSAKLTLHVSGCTHAHHQEYNVQLYLQPLVQTIQ